MKIFHQNSQKLAHPTNSSHRHNTPLFFPIQKKLAVGKADDIYEREADTLADKVVQHSEAGRENAANPFFPPRQVAQSSLQGSITPLIQSSKLDEEPLQKKCETCEKEENIQTKSSNSPNAVPPNFEKTLNSTKGGGSPLKKNIKGEMEAGFGTNFSKVRIHTDSTAEKLNEKLGAQAFTTGNNIYFNSGKFSPESKEGKHLLAHELTHTLQQNGGSKTPIQKQENTTLQMQMAGTTASAEACTGFEEQIRLAKDAAAQWVSATRQWFANYENLIRTRAPRNSSAISIGSEIYRNFRLLEDNFRISRHMRIEVPTSSYTQYTSEQFVALAQASSTVRSNFINMDVASQTAMCFNETCPTGRVGTEVFGSAFAGSREYTLNTQCWSPLGENLRAGVVLHECFHSKFSSFTGDTYSFEPNYPGGSAMTNAESYAIFASIIGSNSSYRSIVLEETLITGAISSEAETEVPETETTPAE